jgi:hypothetical protein
MPVEAALALLGLYLRARDDFTLRRLPGFRETLGRGLFYWVLARELLPNAWRSTSAGVQHKQATGDDRVLQLFMSAITRLDRALRSRDRLHHQMKLEQNNDTADEALFFLDTFLVFLVAAFDAVGRAAHLTYSLDASRLHEVSWRPPLPSSWTTAHPPVTPSTWWRFFATPSTARRSGRSLPSTPVDPYRTSFCSPRTKSISCLPSSIDGEATTPGESKSCRAAGSPCRWTSLSSRSFRWHSTPWTR